MNETSELAESPLAQKDRPNRLLQRRGMGVITAVILGILALTILCIGLDLTRVEASEPPIEAALPAIETADETPTIGPVDTVLALDHSASMEFDTLCYGCWERVIGETYPDGNIYPLHWSDSTIASADHCRGWSSGTGYSCGEYITFTAPIQRNECNYRDSNSTDRY